MTNDLTGVWFGEYAYPVGEAPVAFIANLDERDGVIAGRVDEPTRLSSHRPVGVGGPACPARSVRRGRLRIVVEILESVAERVAVVTDVFRLPRPLGCFKSVVAPLLVLLLIHRPDCVLSLSLALLALLLARPDRDCLPPPEHV